MTLLSFCVHLFMLETFLWCIFCSSILQLHLWQFYQSNASSAEEGIGNTATTIIISPADSESGYGDCSINTYSRHPSSQQCFSGYLSISSPQELQCVIPSDSGCTPGSYSSWTFPEACFIPKTSTGTHSGGAKTTHPVEEPNFGFSDTWSYSFECAHGHGWGLQCR